MTGYKNLLEETRLMASPPETVYEWLRARGDAQIANGGFVAKDGIEAALAKRKEPLALLGLAEFGMNKDVAKALWEKVQAKDDPFQCALRYAMLSNRPAASMHTWTAFPGGLASTKDGLDHWFTTATEEDLSALFSNEFIPDEVLRDYFEGKDTWKSLGETHQLLVLSTLAGNPRMSTRKRADGLDDWDGYTDYMHRSVFDAAWNLATWVPKGTYWAMALGELFKKMPTQSHSLKDPLAVAKTWVPDPADADAVKLESDLEKQYGRLPPWSTVRKGLARLAIESTPVMTREKFFDDPDVAVRCAAYSSLNVPVDRFAEFLNRDGPRFFIHAVANARLWREEARRSALHQAARTTDQADKSGSPDALRTYRWYETDFRKSYPEWFKEEETPETPEIEDDDRPATKADARQIVEFIAARQDDALRQIGAALRPLIKQVPVIFWVSIGALAATLYFHWPR